MVSKFRLALKRNGLRLLKALRIVAVSTVLATALFALVNILPAVTLHAIPAPDHLAAPTLTAAITSPSNNAIYPVGQFYNVTATISATCPVLIDWSPFVQPVYAIAECRVAARNVRATISITGNASIQEAATKDVATSLACAGDPGGCVSTGTASWQVRCTGPGPVTITVTPYGEYDCFVTGNPDLFVKTVYATLIQYCPIPGDHLISNSITITQMSSNNLNNDSSYGNSPSFYSPTQADIKVLTVSAQSDQVASGQPNTIYANVINRGDSDGSFAAILKINGIEEATKIVKLAGNTGTHLEFTVYKVKPGGYNVDINGQQTSFTVIGTSSSEQSSFNFLYLYLAIVCFVMFGIVALLVVRILRQRQDY